MIRALSTAATGMEAQQTQLDVTSHNIANVSTNGFKKNRAEFADLLYQTVRAPGAPTGPQTQAPTGLQIGMGVRTVDVQRQHTQGSIQQTGNPLDVAIEGEGFIPVQLPSGELAYTRDGALKIDNEGHLVTAEGYLINSDAQIPPDAQHITISPTGVVAVQLPGEPGETEVGRVELATFANPTGLQAMGKNLLREATASGTPIVGAPGENGIGTLLQGAVEGSNVQVVEEMIDLISGQRAYEINSRVVRAADEMLGQTANLR